MFKQSHRARNSVCNEFLEEWDAASPLLPQQLAQRARARVIIDRFARQYVPNFYSILVRQVCRNPFDAI